MTATFRYRTCVNTLVALLALSCWTSVSRAQPPADAAAPPRSSAYPNPVQPSSYNREMPVDRQARGEPPRRAVSPLATPTGERTPLPTASKGNRTVASSSGAKNIVTMLVSLTFVLGVFAVVLWLLRRGVPSASRVLPKEVVEVLGHATLAHRQQAQLLRLGNKLLLIGISSDGPRTLSETADVQEVERLTEICRQAAASEPSALAGLLPRYRRKGERGEATKATPSRQIATERARNYG